MVMNVRRRAGQSRLALLLAVLLAADAAGASTCMSRAYETASAPRNGTAMLITAQAQTDRADRRQLRQRIGTLKCVRVAL